MKRRIISIAVAITLAVFTATVAGAQVPISGLPSATPAGADTVPIVHSGVTSRTTISAILGLSTNVSTVSTGSNLTGGGAGPTPAPIAVASPTATAVPMTCTGWSATFVLQTYTCPTAGSNIAFSATNVIRVASPAPTSVPSSCAGWDTSFNLTTQPCATATGGVGTAGSNINITTGVISVASPVASACPSSMAGFSATWALQFQTGCAITTATAGSNLAGGGTGPTVTLALASPAATAQPSSCAGFSATWALQHANNSCALVGVSKTAFTITVLPTATTLSTPTAGFYSRAFMVSLDMVSPTVDSEYAYCDNAGSGTGQVTFRFYENFGAAPTFTTSNPVATSASWASGTAIGGGATFAPVALPTSTTANNPTWVFAVVSGLPATTAPGGACIFELHGLQRIIQ